MLNTTAVLLFCTFTLQLIVVYAGVLPEETALRGKKIPACSDGSNPLLGAVEGIVSCKSGCPEGFFCEYLSAEKRPENGICCADLEILTKLYGDSEESTRNKQVVTPSLTPM
ncbi:unnamed protein product [Enterobius vermicularis]|uniref:Secreted protein n=1 Tax=Enterobius vermicularis TaxID=51028 RepID=A0A0N4UT82_ENTVE|nr:unnamed protein product [Enterobius vermicularis]